MNCSCLYQFLHLLPRFYLLLTTQGHCQSSYFPLNSITNSPSLLNHSKRIPTVISFSPNSISPSTYPFVSLLPFSDDLLGVVYIYYLQFLFIILFEILPNTIKFTILKCMIQWFKVVQLSNYLTPNIFITKKKTQNPIPISNHFSSPPSHSRSKN